MPKTCPNVPSEILNPRNTWENKNDYDKKANELAQAFLDNFKQFEEFADKAIIQTLPKVAEKATS